MTEIDDSECIHGRTQPGEAQRHLMAVLGATTWPVEECINWPFGRSKKGYGSVYFAGKMRATHQLACELLHGPCPFGLQTRHLCGNSSCFNPNHVVWGTPSRNSRDRADHGTERRGELAYTAKLTRELVLAIRNEEGSHKDIALVYGVHPSQVCRIRNRKSWAWLK